VFPRLAVWARNADRDAFALRGVLPFLNQFSK